VNWRILLVLAMGSGATPAWADHAVVFPFRAINVPEGDARVATHLFRTEYQQASGHSVASLDEAAAALDKNADPAAACRALGCQVYVTGDVSRLGSRVLVSAEEHDWSGKTRWTENASAASIEGIEGLLPRMAQALVRKQARAEPRIASAPEAPPPPTVWEEPAPQVRRRLLGFRAGVHQPIVSGLDLSPAVSLAFNAHLNWDGYFVAWAAGGSLPASDTSDSLGVVFGEIGGGGYLGDGEVAAYLAAAISPRFLIYDVDFDADAGVGMAVIGKFGVMFARTQRMRLFAEVGADQELLGTNLDAFDDNVRPTTLRFDFGMGW